MAMAATHTTAAEIVARPYARVLTPAEEGGYTATVLEFPGCISEGDTAEAAIANVDEAMAGFIEDMLAAGEKIPGPLETRTYSGELRLRMLPSVHRAAAMRAAEEGVSLNRFLAAAVSAYIAGAGPDSV